MKAFKDLNLQNSYTKLMCAYKYLGLAEACFDSAIWSSNLSEDKQEDYIDFFGDRSCGLRNVVKSIMKEIEAEVFKNMRRTGMGDGFPWSTPGDKVFDNMRDHMYWKAKKALDDLFEQEEPMTPAAEETRG